MAKVLLIEDDKEQMFLFETYLSMKGFTVKVASSAAEVFDYLKGDKPDIIISDILLRGENGLDIVARIKEDETLKALPVFVFTNTNKKDFKDRATAMGVSDFIIKSDVTPQELAAKIHKQLGIAA